MYLLLGLTEVPDEVTVSLANDILKQMLLLVDKADSNTLGVRSHTLRRGCSQTDFIPPRADHDSDPEQLAECLRVGEFLFCLDEEYSFDEAGGLRGIVRRSAERCGRRSCPIGCARTAGR